MREVTRLSSRPHRRSDQERSSNGTHSSFVVQLLGMHFARCKFHKITISALNHHICLALSAEHGFGRLTSTDDALVLHVGIPHGGSKSSSGCRNLAADRLCAWVGRVNRIRGLNNEEVNALKRADQTLAGREAGRWIGKKLCREGKDPGRFETGAVEVFLLVEGLAGLGLHSLVGFGRVRHGGNYHGRSTWKMVAESKVGRSRIWSKRKVAGCGQRDLRIDSVKECGEVLSPCTGGEAI